MNFGVVKCSDQVYTAYSPVYFIRNITNAGEELSSMTLGQALVRIAMLMKSIDYLAEIGHTDRFSQVDRPVTLDGHVQERAGESA